MWSRTPVGHEDEDRSTPRTKRLKCYLRSNVERQGDTMKTLTVRKQTLKGLFARLAPIALLAALFTAQAALAQVPPTLGKTQTFAVLGATTVTNTGPTVVTGDLGLSPGTSVTGFPPGTVVGGSIHATDPLAGQAQTDNTTAYGDLAAEACNTTYAVPTDLSGLTLVPGVYCFDSSAALTGTVTLDAGGVVTAVWVFKINSTLTTGSSSVVKLTNGAQNCNVFWQVGSSATIGTSSTFVGSIFALTSITLTTDAKVFGRALAQNGAVTMDSNTVAVPVCATSPVAPILGKAFNPASINAGGTSSLTITLSNPGTTSATLSDPLVDTMPSGVVTSGSASTTCSGGTASSTSTEVTLTGGSIAAGGSCTLTVGVTAPAGGSFINSIAAGALMTSNGNNAGPAVATLTVNTPIVAPTLGKAFIPPTINASGTSTLTITLSNAGTTPASLSEPLVDTMPSGLVIAATPVPSNTCGGTVSTTTSEVTLTGGSILAGESCTVTVTVNASAGGNYINSLAAGALVTSNGSNVAPAVATLTVNSPAVVPTLGKAFNPPTINTTSVPSTLTITLGNAGATSASLSAPLVDTMPSGLVIAATPAPSNTCGGTVSATTSEVTLTGGSIPPGGCTVTVTVNASAGGSYINSLAAGALATNLGSNAAPAIATLTVSTPSAVTIGKAFSPPTIIMGGVSTLTITLTNTGATPASLTAALVDTLPSGVVLDGSVSSTCSSSDSAVTSAVLVTGRSNGIQSPHERPVPLWLISGTSTVGLKEGSIPAKSSCTVTANVTAPLPGGYFNSLPAGALQTNNGNNAAPAVATLTVLPVTLPLAINFEGPAVSNLGGGDSSFVADEYFTGGGAATPTKKTINVAAAAPNAAPMAVYQTQRDGVFTYTIPGLTAGSTYTVLLHFAEIYFTKAGEREYDVAINGTRVLTNFDQFAAAGGAYIAVVKVFTATANSSGQIVIAYTRGAVNQPSAAGLEIRQP